MSGVWVTIDPVALGRVQKAPTVTARPAHDNA
jgi:hypothetical protein